ncbi:MAG: M1 family metallopeptidase [Chitinophagales bacterium]|nr:M1 family metallopeptidase [Chitinophagales bacterium]
MLKILVLLATLAVLAAEAQMAGYDPNRPPNDYRSKANPYYWKNRMPHAAYWQQDVYYRIVASVDERTHQISGSEWLVYWNNSPDTLHEVFFHLYQQAFVKGGHLEALNRANAVKQQFGPYESAGKGCLLEQVTADGIPLTWEQDFSIVRMELPRPLLPEDSMTFHLVFTTFFDSGSQRRRMKKFPVNGYTHYDGVHWYPRICVYDARAGWNTDQHLGREFYGNFGTFDVQLTLASHYVVGATGTLLNESEVLPAALRQQLDLKNFADKPWNSKASEIIPYDPRQRKTWHFYAENVHDFAFTADPTYRIGETYATVFDPHTGAERTVLCQALAQEPHAAFWQDAADFAALLITIYSRDFGAYLWPKIIVADAADGMEYPMVTLDGGRSPGYFGLLAHEVGHMWFFGHVANNETYRAFLDEGFTQFLESWAMRRIFGDTLPSLPPDNRYLRKHRSPLIQHHQRVYHPYLLEAISGTDEPVNQHSDGFNSALGHGGGYRMVYFKTATMLYNLQYVLGDSLFLVVMQHYFDKWKLAHPYPEDFRLAVSERTGMDLNWFFDQWLETTKKLDYGIRSVRPLKQDSAYVPLPLRTHGAASRIPCNGETDCYRIRLSRKGRMQSSLDVTVMAKDHRSYSFHIPNTWYIKSTESTVLPKWYGWDRLHPAYDMKVFIPSGIRQVVIDPSQRMADVYMPDNIRPFRPQMRWDYLLQQPVNWTRYQLYGRPDVWYNGPDGLKVGFNLSGSYMEKKHVFALTAWVRTGLFSQPLHSGPGRHTGLPLFATVLRNTSCRTLPVYAELSYSNVIPRLAAGASWSALARAGEGVYQLRTRISLPVRTATEWQWGYELLYRPRTNSCYLLRPEDWTYDHLNSFVLLSFRKQFRYFSGSGWWQLMLRAPVLTGSQQAYSYLSGEAFNRWQTGKTILRLRAYVRAGTGADAPRESLLYLGGAAPESLMDNRFLRSRGWFPPDWYAPDGDPTIRLHAGGGLNVRAFSWLYAFNESPESMLPAATSGYALNAEWDVSGWFRMRPSFTRQWLSAELYLFVDGGQLAEMVSEEAAPLRMNFSSFYADAGPGIALTIRRWLMWDKLQPLTLRADFPVAAWPAIGEGAPIAFRCVVGIGRSF